MVLGFAFNHVLTWLNHLTINSEGFLVVFFFNILDPPLARDVVRQTSDVLNGTERSRRAKQPAVASRLDS